MTDPLADLADTPLETLLASVDNALRNGSHMTNANLAFLLLCDRLGVDRDGLTFDPRWSAKVSPPEPGASRCPRCGGTAPLGDYGVCVPCAAACGWDPPCPACRAEDAGRDLGELQHVGTCWAGARR